MIKPQPNWQTAQEHEKNWWGTCTNTFWEETKQMVYARKMGLNFHEGTLDLEGKSILDIGGGPVSLLLKTINGKIKTVVDPCDYPLWVKLRYDAARIKLYQKPAEEFGFSPGVQFQFDEVWIYNVLQHVKDPQKIIDNAKKISKCIRIFEWIEAETDELHLHTLTQYNLDSWLRPSISDKWQIENLDESGCVGKAYYGTFNY